MQYLAWKIHWRDSAADYMKKKKGSVSTKPGPWNSPNQSKGEKMGTYPKELLRQNQAD